MKKVKELSIGDKRDFLVFYFFIQNVAHFSLWDKFRISSVKYGVFEFLFSTQIALFFKFTIIFCRFPLRMATTDQHNIYVYMI